MSAIINRRLLNRARRHADKLQKQIEAARQSGQTLRVRRLVRRYLNSWSAKLVAVADAYRELPRHHQKAGMKAEEIAARLNPFEGTDERVVLHFKTKKTEHDFRPVMDFGIVNRALQYLVLSPLRALVDLHPCQFGNHGGVCAAAQKVLDNLEEGYRHVVEIDINNYFPSVSGEALSDHLLIPHEVTERVVISRHLNLYPGNFNFFLGDPLDGADIEDFDASDPLCQAIEEGRRGIPQGSATSSLIAEMLLAPTLAALPGCGRVVGYLDNILVMGKTADDVSLMKSNLKEALLGHPVGPFVSRIMGAASPGKGFDYLGYEFFQKGATYKVRPSGYNMSKFCHTFDHGLDKIEDKDLSHAVRVRMAKHLERYVRSWTAAFRLWEKTDKFRLNRLEQIRDVNLGEVIHHGT